MLTARWTGLDDIVKKAEALGREVADNEVMGRALLRTAQPLRDDITRTAPRSRVAPHVAETFVAKVSREERDLGRVTVLVGPQVGYPGFIAPFLEFGTSKMRARPWIRPSYDAWRTTAFPGALVAEMRKQYERVVRKYVSRARSAAA